MSFLVHLFFTCLVLINAHLLKEREPKLCKTWLQNQPHCKNLEMVCPIREDKIKLVKNGLSKKIIKRYLTISWYISMRICATSDSKFMETVPKKSAQFSLRNPTLKDHVCQFIKKKMKNLFSAYRGHSSGY